MASAIEFFGRFNLTFSDAGAPEAASFEGFCYTDWRPQRLPDFDWTKVGALKTEMAPCPADTVWPSS